MITDSVEETLKPAPLAAENLPTFVIREYPDELLTKPCQPFVDVVKDNVRLQTYFNVMEKTMQVHGGAGLAAPQIGLMFRIIVIRLADGKPLVMINPLITQFGGKTVSENEGCLSFPGLFIKVKRASSVEVTFKNRDGEEVTRWFNDTEAREVQHEIDHIDGIVFIDRIPKFQRHGLLQKMRIAQRQNVAKRKEMEKFIARLKKQQLPQTSVVPAGDQPLNAETIEKAAAAE